MSQQHTTTPWKTWDTDPRVILAQDGDTIADTRYPVACGEGQQLHPLQIGNAAFIVQAVNAHAALVMNLQAAVNYFDKHGIDGQDLHVHEMRAALSQVTQ